MSSPTFQTAASCYQTTFPPLLSPNLLSRPSNLPSDARGGYNLSMKVQMPTQNNNSPLSSPLLESLPAVQPVNHVADTFDFHLLPPPSPVSMIPSPTPFHPYELLTVNIPDNALLGLSGSADIKEDSPQEQGLLPCPEDPPVTPMSPDQNRAYFQKFELPTFSLDPKWNSKTTERGQFDSGARASVTNLKYALFDLHEFKSPSECPVRMYGATNKNLLISPEAKGKLRLPAHNAQGFVDIVCYYSPSFSTTLISDSDIIRCTGFPQDYSGQSTQKFFEQSDRLSQAHRQGEYLIDKLYNVDEGNCLITCHHKRNSNRNIILPGIIKYGQCFSGNLILPKLDPDHPIVTSQILLNQAKQNDPSFAQLCKDEAIQAVFEYQETKFKNLQSELASVPSMYHDVPFHDIIYAYTPIHALTVKTERKLWHQRLCHMHPDIIQNAHKFVDGVPEFKGEPISPELDKCTTCIKSKFTKVSPGPGLQPPTIPYQGLAMDFSFSGVVSKDKSRRQDIEGLNGETSWLLIKCNFTKILHGDTLISKAPPVQFLKQFLQTYSPECSGKYVILDQGGELYQSPAIRNLFKKFNYAIYPTGSDASFQNPVERSHRSAAEAIRAMLVGANLPAKFWPYAFHHYLRIKNGLPSKSQSKSPIELTTGKREDLSNLKTFGCRVWSKPPTRRKAKFKCNARKGIFLGYLPHTKRNILYYDVQTDKVKIATHIQFDEAFNDLPPDALPPNVQSLLRTDSNIQSALADDYPLDSRDLNFFIYPFATTFTGTIPIDPTNANMGFKLNDDSLRGRTYITDFIPSSSAANLLKDLKSTRRKLRGAFIYKINGKPVFNSADASAALTDLQKQGRDSSTTDSPPNVEIIFGIEPHLNAKTLRKAIDDYFLLAPATSKAKKRSTRPDPEAVSNDDGSPRFKLGTKVYKLFDGIQYEGKIIAYDANACLYKIRYEDNDEEEMYHIEVSKHLKPIPRNKRKNKRIALHKIAQSKLAPTELDEDYHCISLNAQTIRAIAAARLGTHITHSEVSDEAIRLFTISSENTTDEEASLGHFTRRKLKGLTTWDKWLAGEAKQLNQFHKQNMFGDPVDISTLDKDAIILRPHWNYTIKKDGTRRSRLCGDGSKRAAPKLHDVAATWSSCVELPIQRMFLAICALKNLQIYGADVVDAYSHSPAEEETYLKVDNA